MTTAASVGLKLDKPAARRGSSPAWAEALLEPFIQAGIVDVQAGRLVLVDCAFAFVLAAEEARPA